MKKRKMPLAAFLEAVQQLRDGQDFPSILCSSTTCHLCYPGVVEPCFISRRRCSCPVLWQIGNCTQHFLRTERWQSSQLNRRSLCARLACETDVDGSPRRTGDLRQANASRVCRPVRFSRGGLSCNTRRSCAFSMFGRPPWTAATLPKCPQKHSTSCVPGSVRQGLLHGSG